MGTLTPWVALYLKQGRKQGSLSKTTAANSYYVLAKLDRSFGDRQLETFGRRAIERWLEDNSHWTPSTRRTNFARVRQFTKWLLQHRLLKTDPFIDLKAPKAPRPVPRPIDRVSIDALLAAAPDARGRLIVLLMFSMGLRCIGVSSLRIEDIDHVSKVLIVKEKFGNERRLPITAVVSQAIDMYLQEVPGTSGPLIRNVRPSAYSAAISPAHIGGMVTDWMKAAGVKHYGHDGRNAHALRHTALTELAEATGDAFLVQELAGWSSPATAAHYVRRASTERLREALAKRDEAQNSDQLVGSATDEPPGVER